METYRNNTGRFIAAEGLDGTGKTTITKELADQTGSRFYSWKDGKLAQFRERFDSTAPFPRFVYFLAVGMETGMKASKMISAGDDVYVDRTVVSTIAYHRALGVPKMWMSLIPKGLIDQIDILLYFTAPNEVRNKRILDRVAQVGGYMDNNDGNSLILGDAIDREYRLVLPSRTLVVKNHGRKIDEVVSSLKGQLYAK